ncbi:beta-ketoacyl-ACP synthase [Snodgrassella sp. ESL0324]|uniref:beta-ketoacyl-ACP synthase n=1 Tax=Snodgrassella sp. ESL0324 TaxID=2705033 RepID=UPI0015817241|nr:beta-ketoacyl-ACP synthase [Snodgrassella sp. ESL0324]NUF09049.1 beta-ketoacyl-ACP synthase [Snodgrassella sp. ESL0324]
MLRRVVITGMSGVSALGNDWASVKSGLLAYKNKVVRMESWDRYQDLNTRLAAPVTDYSPPAHWTRKQLRSMGKVAQMCTQAAENALADAGLLGDESIKDGRMGVACGSSTGSPQDIRDISELVLNGSSANFNANTYVRIMPHTTAANLSIFFGLTGRVIPTSSACASGNQAIGYAYEAIKSGKIDMMLAGGGEELCVSEAFVFDSLYATSLRNETPELSPSPYDADRDGLVIGEGAGILVLEEYEMAKARGARIYAEVVGFACTSDGSHITRPERTTMRRCMQMALEDAHLSAAEVGYINGHGTATEQGDIAETLATADVFGYVPISSQKSYLGHTLGACGALESWFSIHMMNEGWFAPTLNLNQIDSRCGELDYIVNKAREIDTEFVMNNNFAFGGVNSSLIFKRMS